LDPGDYKLDVQALHQHEWISAPGPVQISIAFPWWQRWWVIALAFAGMLAGVVFFFRQRINRYRNKMMIAQQVAELEAKALRAQMNPHFVFNCLNTIQEYVITGKVEEAYTYLSKFARLLRLVLEQSEHAEVNLSDELEVLTLYVSLEQIRFRGEMEFEFSIADDLQDEDISIPTMLLQPHLENAIWHGLRNKPGHKQLLMQINRSSPGYLEVIIEDNGVGREKAAALRRERLGPQSYKSKGRQLAQQRIDILQREYPETTMETSDITATDGTVTGTRVRILMPVLDSRSGS
jgi:LytS/YehU family sensor histidine kinase